ncbi:MAG: FKBP-type peptidyl-prolyl cis-trans isomerase [Proteobacteria bacterium]|nr:FKBP-type peptidyl-prolyl cis-trans isomerase [Pseudomonadota bacterium]
MTEITRVPLQPLAKGSLRNLWLGVAVTIAAAGGLAIAAKPPMVEVRTVTPGKVEPGRDASPSMEDVVVIDYIGKLANGTVFDRAEKAVLPLQGVVPGFSRALLQMQRGGTYLVKIPPKLGYGDRAVGPIPANSELTFEIKLIDFMNARQYQQQMMMIEQMRQMQGQQRGHGGPAGAPAGDAPPQ